MNKEYYILHLEEPALPGFVSGEKIYVGTEAELRNVATNMENKEQYLETAKSIHDYFNGNQSAKHSIAYNIQNVLIPINVEAECKTSFNQYQWTHYNIWGFPYEMKCDNTLIHQIVFKYENRFYRCVRAWLKNLQYKSVSGSVNYLKGGFWGNAVILDVATDSETEDFIFNNLLYVAEEKYDDISAATEDLGIDTKIELKRICDEIFADG